MNALPVIPFTRLHTRIPGLMRASAMMGLVALFLLVGIIARAAPALALPVGSFSFNFEGFAPADTKIRVTLVSEEVLGSGLMFVRDFVMDISGNDRNTATNNLRQQFADRGIQDSFPSSFSTNVTGITDKNPNDPNQTVTAAIKKIDGNSPLVLDGTDVKIQTGVKPGDTWKAFFQPGLDPTLGTTTPGALVIDIPGVAPLSTVLDVGTTPTSASKALFNLLVSNGFPGVELQANEVSFLLSPTNDLIAEVAGFSFAGANLHYGLEIPSAVPEPSTLLLVGTGLVGAGAAAWKRNRRK